MTPAAPSRGVLTRAADAVRWFIDLPRRRALVDELSMLSDHELADIGLNRAELDRVFDPDFTSARADYRRVAACAARL
ncbi:MAG: DUF1127 domain-containing protein [Acidisphaera sp.]|nr:DUF1127 domain-containing protein [Acidisphaera sp.]